MHPRPQTPPGETPERGTAVNTWDDSAPQEEPEDRRGCGAAAATAYLIIAFLFIFLVAATAAGHPAP